MRPIGQTDDKTRVTDSRKTAETPRGVCGRLGTDARRAHRMTNRARGSVIAFAALILGGATCLFVPSGPERTHSIVTTILVAAPAAVAWNALKSFETMTGELPAALALGLPVPTRCTLDGESAGGRRVCHFDSGSIEQRVTRWEPPHQMDLKIVSAKMPGAHVFEYRTASYTLSEEGGRTRVTRTTTITSKLRPAWYFWKLEEVGVQAEHEYLLKTLATHLEERNQ